MEINRQIIVNRPLKEVWRALSDEFGGIDKWDSRVSSSRLEGKGKLLGLSYSSRILETDQGEKEEVMTTHDPSTYSLSYRCKEGLPIQVTKVSTAWSMANTQEGVEIRLQLNVQLNVYGFLVYPLILYRQGDEADRMLQDFKSYIESGMITHE